MITGNWRVIAMLIPSFVPLTAGDNRVVFFGDSITDSWKLDDSFPGKQYVNRGIGGQTTPQMLVRYRQDVVDLQPKVVVILAGTNDIAGNTGPMRNEDIEANFASFAELARVHNIRVVYSSILPVHNYTDRVEGFLCAAATGEDSGAQRVAEGLLCEEQDRLSRLLFGAGG